MGNRKSSPLTKIGTYSLMLGGDVRINLIDCCYSSKMTQNIISFHALFRKGFRYSFDDVNGSILVYKNGVYETVTCVDNLVNNLFHIDSSNGVDKACL